MKRLLLYFFLVFICVGVQAQRNDNVWPLSYYWGSPGTYYNLDFSSGAPDTITYQRKMSFFVTNAAINDSSGNLLYYTNGQWVANRAHDTLLNSQNFNPGWGTLGSNGSEFSQSALFLPFADSLNVYIVHNSLDTFHNVDGVLDGQPFNLRYSLIDKTLDNGNGGIVQGKKNVIAIDDTLLLGRITACKHANGRDWWVITHKYYSDIYYKLLFTPDNVYGPYIQHIGPVLKPKVLSGTDFDLLGMAVFSPDGSKYVNTDFDTMHVYDFDRCTGLLSNLRSAHPQIADSIRILGCSFSADSKYLYANTRLKAFQIDTDIPNIDSSISLVATYDGFLNPTNTWFFLNQLGPDGKIYISTYNGTRVLHVIENPDDLGLACSFNQHSYILPPNYGGNSSLPNFSNYRLGPLAGSPCDTLSLSIAEFSEKDIGIKISPNPNSGNFIINYSLPQNKSGTLEIFDVLGKRVYAQALPPWSIVQRIDAGALPQGMYVCVVKSEGVSKGVKWVKE